MNATSPTGAALTSASGPAASSWDADDAVTASYAAHWPGLVRLATLLLGVAESPGDSAATEEIAQDAFVALHGRWRRLRDPDRALAYLRPAPGPTRSGRRRGG